MKRESRKAKASQGLGAADERFAGFGIFFESWNAS
jgi:hypothetical protein